MAMTREPKTKERQAYEQLRELIVRGELPHGEFLSQRMLTARVNSTMVNVRPALRQLESDGLLENIPRFGVRIPIEDEESIRDRYFVREVLEVAAVRRLIALRPVQGESSIYEMARMCDVPASGDDDDVFDFAAHHYELHCAIVQASQSAMLLDAYRRVQLTSMMVWNAQSGWLRGKNPGPNHHQRLVDAIMTATERAAIAETRVHVHSGLQNELEAHALETTSGE
jgi:DNA-binding GntR family transcriptional regulator